MLFSFLIHALKFFLLQLFHRSTVERVMHENWSALSNMKTYPLMKKKQKNATDTIPEVQWERNTFHNKTHHLLKSWKKITGEKITWVILKQTSKVNPDPHATCNTQNTNPDACKVHEDDKLAVLAKEEIYYIYEPPLPHNWKQYGSINYQQERYTVAYLTRFTNIIQNKREISL